MKEIENFRALNCNGCQCNNCFECSSANCDICYRAEFATDDCEDMYYSAESGINEFCDFDVH